MPATPIIPTGSTAADTPGICWGSAPVAFTAAVVYSPLVTAVAASPLPAVPAIIHCSPVCVPLLQWQAVLTPVPCAPGPCTLLLMSVPLLWGA